MHTFFFVILVLLFVCVFRERVEMFTVFKDGPGFRASLEAYYKDSVKLRGLIDVNNSVATVVVQRNGRLFVDKVWFDDNHVVLDHARVSESVTDYMTFDRYDTLFNNIRARFDVTGFTRLNTEGSVTAVVYDESTEKSRVYDITFQKDTLAVLSDRFLNIEFIKQPVQEGNKPEYVYDIGRFFVLLKNVHLYFGPNKQQPHGTIRLTKDVLTVIVVDPSTFASVVYDVRYDHETMAIRNVALSDMTFVLESTSDMHRLIKKSALL